jgi:hypothetical protein
VVVKARLPTKMFTNDSPEEKVHVVAVSSTSWRQNMVVEELRGMIQLSLGEHARKCGSTQEPYYIGSVVGRPPEVLTP